MLPPSKLVFVDKRADLTAGVLSGAFTLNLSAADAGKAEAFDVIYSQGPLDGSGNLLAHPVLSLDLPFTGSAMQTAVSSAADSPQQLCDTAMILRQSSFRVLLYHSHRTFGLNAILVVMLTLSIPC